MENGDSIYIMEIHAERDVLKILIYRSGELYFFWSNYMGGGFVSGASLDWREGRSINGMTPLYIPDGYWVVSNPIIIYDPFKFPLCYVVDLSV